MSARIVSIIASSAPGAWAPSRRSTITAALAVATAALALLHVVLLWDRVRSGAILEPAVMLRWTGAALLLWLMRCLLRQDGSRSRLVRGIALASLVGFLHLSFATSVARTGDSDGTSAAILALAVPLCIAVPLGMAAALAVRALVACARHARRFAVLADPAAVGRCFIELTLLPHFLVRHSLAFRAPPA